MALTDLVLMPGADYEDICKAIRKKTGTTDPIKSYEASGLIEGISGGIPENFSSYKTGTYIPSSDTAGSTVIKHGLGQTPNFFCIYAKGSSLPGSGYIVSGMGTKLIGSTGQGMYIYGTTAGTAAGKSGFFSASASTFSLQAGTNKYKSGVTYEWIVGVI